MELLTSYKIQEQFENTQSIDKLEKLIYLKKNTFFQELWRNVAEAVGTQNACDISVGFFWFSKSIPHQPQ